MALMTNDLPPGVRRTEDGFVRDVQPNELAGERITRLTDANGRYIQGARGRSARAYAARGGLNSSLAAAGGEAAAIDAAAPIGMHEAETYSSAARDTLGSLANQRISAEGNATQRNIAELRANTDMTMQERGFGENLRERDWRTGERVGEQDFSRSEREGTQTFQSGENTRDRDWRSSEASQDRNLERESWRFTESSAARGARHAVALQVLNTVLNNPSYFRDPQGAAGAIEFFTSEVDRIFDELFPEVNTSGGG